MSSRLAHLRFAVLALLVLPSACGETTEAPLVEERRRPDPPTAPDPGAGAPSPSPTPDLTLLDYGEDRWRCEPGAGQHQLEALPPRPGGCDARAGRCGRFEEAFASICAGAAPAPSGMSPAGPDVEVTFGDEPVRCRRRANSFLCSVVCYHAVAELTVEEAERRFERHVDDLRDRYGAETDAMIQGVASVPRRRHRWRSEGGTLSTELVVDLCDRDDGRRPLRQMRTHFDGAGGAR